MTDNQQHALKLLEVGVPQIIQMALQLESLLIQQRMLMSPDEWQEVVQLWRAQVRTAMANDPESNTPETWQQLQEYLFPMLKASNQS